MNLINFDQKVLFLAPLAGFSDPPFRSVVKKFGCDVTVSEMISANALVFENEKTLKMLEKSPNETPFLVQLSGENPENFARAVKILNKFDGIDGIDLNCGCPVPKVVKQNAGSALLKDIPNLIKILKTIKKTSEKRYLSAKIRLGFDEKNAHEFAQIFEDAGVDFLCVHGRTRNGMYSAKVDYEAIARIKDAVKIPVIANGDVSYANFAQVLEITHADGLMIGRGAIGRPWIFSEIKANSTASNSLKREVILAHFDAMIAHYGERGAAIFRKHLHEYSKGAPNASAFRQKINQIPDALKMRAEISEFFGENCD